MKSQNQIILSLGSNQGNRLQNIENAIATIHQEAGTVIKISKLYETPSWGFDGNAFYNCAILLHTFAAAHKILEIILTIEKRLGRVRTISSEYQSRMIDIDLITFNEEIIDSEILKVPHPLMHNRNFVLLPMLI